MASARIMIVEDEHITAVDLQQSLQAFGYPVFGGFAGFQYGLMQPHGFAGTLFEQSSGNHQVP